MSGGSYAYAFNQIAELASEIEHRADGRGGGQRALRIAFAQHLHLCAEAAKAIEWVDSCDWGTGDEVAPILKVLRAGAELQVCIREAQAAREELDRALERATGATTEHV